MSVKFEPGFRLTKLDVAFIFIALATSAILSKYTLYLTFTVLFVVAHFFLFCNVVRMSRLPELIWAGTFTLLAISTYKTGLPTLLVTALLCLISTIILVGLEVRKPSYHGVFWQRFNPNLPVWFKENISNKN